VANNGEESLMDWMDWPTFVVTLGLATVLGILCAGRDRRTGRLAYLLWLLWATLVFPSGALVLKLGPGAHFPTFGALYLLLQLGQLFALGGKTAMRLRDAGMSRWLALPAAIPFLGIIPGIALAFVPSAPGASPVLVGPSGRRQQGVAA
jgi:uncharacterized membrane protein YhaH (DUF805 family)